MTTNATCQCGHRIDQHTYSEDYTGCDIDGCNCHADLGGMIDTQSQRIDALEKALEVFAADDLCDILGGNCDGEESVVFGRKNTELKIKHFRAARALLATRTDAG